MLYAVFRIGNATDNISWESYQAMAALLATLIGGYYLVKRLGERHPPPGDGQRLDPVPQLNANEHE